MNIKDSLKKSFFSSLDSTISGSAYLLCQGILTNTQKAEVCKQFYYSVMIEGDPSNQTRWHLLVPMKAIHITASGDSATLTNKAMSVINFVHRQNGFSRFIHIIVLQCHSIIYKYTHTYSIKFISLPSLSPNLTSSSILALYRTRHLTTS